MLPRDLLLKLFSHLGTPRDLVICSAVCQLFADAASEPELWHEVAVHKYGTIVADSTIHLYEGNWKNMVKDDNKRGALPTLTFSRPSFRRYDEENRGIDNRFDCCIVTGVQWDRQNGKVRVYLDARGETDLSHPRESALFIPGDGESLVQDNEGWLEDVGTNDTDLSHIRDSNILITGHDHIAHSWLLTRPECWREDVGKNGHFKGCLVFDEFYFKLGASKLCYECDFSDSDNYEPVVLLPGTLDSSHFDRYTLDDSLFESDAPEVELARWEGVAPERVLLRPGWWV